MASLEDSFGGSVRVDILDDDPAIRALIEHQLKKMGSEIEIRSYETVDEALDSLNESTPDLLLLDLNLGGLSGLKILKEFPRGKRDFPIMVMTSDRRLESADLILSHGAEEIIMKPFDSMTFQGKVEQYLVLPGASTRMIHRKANASMAVDFILNTKALTLNDHSAVMLTTVSVTKGTLIKVQFGGQWLLSRVEDCVRDDVSGYSKLTVDWSETASSDALLQVRKFIVQLRQRGSNAA